MQVLKSSVSISWAMQKMGEHGHGQEQWGTSMTMLRGLAYLEGLLDLKAVGLLLREVQAPQVAAAENSVLEPESVEGDV